MERIAHDKLVPLSELAKHLGPGCSEKRLHVFAKYGRCRPDGIVVRLLTKPLHGYKHASILFYWQMQTKLDPTLIPEMEIDGSKRLCLAMCISCNSWLPFTMDSQRELREDVLKTAYKWKPWKDEGWICAQCAEGT